MPKIAIQRKKAALRKLKISTQLQVYIPPMLDLNNCVATSGNSDIVICQTGLKPGKNAERKHLPNHFTPEQEKR